MLSTGGDHDSVRVIKWMLCIMAAIASALNNTIWNDKT